LDDVLADDVDDEFFRGPDVGQRVLHRVAPHGAEEHHRRVAADGVEEAERREVVHAGRRGRRDEGDRPRYDRADEYSVADRRGNRLGIDDHRYNSTPRIEASRISTTCTIGRSWPLARNAAPICSMHPGLVVAMMSGWASAIIVAFRSPSSAAIAGCTRLKIPALPQQMSLSATGTSVTPGIDARRLRGSWRTLCAWARWQAS